MLTLRGSAATRTGEHGMLTQLTLWRPSALDGYGGFTAVPSLGRPQDDGLEMNAREPVASNVYRFT